jgi:hypothetical protein
MGSDRMGKYVTPFLAVLSLALASMSNVAAQARPVERSARAAALYPIPSAPGARSSAAAAAAYLAKLSPAALAATGGPRLHARTSGPGTFTFVLSAEIHGKTVVIGAGSKTVGRAGAVTVKITFTTAGKAALTGGGKLRITVVATFKPKHGKPKTSKSTVALK